MLNEAAGWLGVALGIIGGAWLGLNYDREGWLGGYSSLPRRLVRLGHIAFIALGFLNILFAQTAMRLDLESTAIVIASWCLAIGAFAMPASCFLNAWHSSLKPLFVIPVVLLATGCITVFFGLVTS